MPPRVDIPEYELVRCIGTGSYGEVWLARGVTGTWRAVKVVRRERFAADTPYEREFEAIRRCEDIALKTPDLVRVYHTGRNDAAGWFYYVMELADDALGAETINPESYEPRTVAAELKARGRLPVEDCLAIGNAVSAALEGMHAAGLVHRDVKPSNIIFINGLPRLADIGLVATLPDTKAMVGTHGYIPHEGPGTTAADIFSLGMVLYEMSTGLDRHEFPDVPAEARSIPPDPRWPELNRVVMRACDNAPEDRYSTTAELAADLQRVAAGQRVSPMRWPWAVAAGLVVLAVILFNKPTKPPAREAAAIDPLKHKLELHYTFDDGPADRSGHGRDALVKWALPARDRHGVAARALLFNTNASVSSPVPHAFTPGEPRALSLWFRIGGWEYQHPATWPRKWETGRGATLAEGLGFLLVARDNGFIGIGGDHINAGWLAPAMPTNRWQHLAVSYNGTMGSFQGWLNGSTLPVVTNGFAFYRPSMPLNAVPNIRFDGRIHLRSFNGQLDDLRVYRRALSAADAKAIWEAEKPRQPTTDEVAWDFNYHHTHVNDPRAVRHVVSTKNLRRWTEDQVEPFTYWAPVTNGVPGVIVYQFDFPNPTRRIFLKAQTYIVDLRAPNGPDAAHGAGAVHASRDGTNWVTLKNELEPKPQWGHTVTWENDLPSELTGTRQLHVKITLLAKGPSGLGYSAAQHNRSGGDATEQAKPRFIVRAQWAD